MNACGAHLPPWVFLLGGAGFFLGLLVIGITARFAGAKVAAILGGAFLFAGALFLQVQLRSLGC